jgi:thiamine-phosphate pyrophosphorylase
MKLILVTSPTYFVEEDKIITALFEEGLDILHLRKPDTPPMYAERLLTLIPEQYHKRIVVHGHFYLKEEFNLRGIHLNERNPLVPDHYKGQTSWSCHTVDEVRQRKSQADYLFMGPIFDSASDPSIRAAFTAEELHRAARNGIIDKHVIALGGITADNILRLKDYNFGGAALCADIWSKFDRCSTHDFSDLIAHFRHIKKLID